MSKRLQVVLDDAEFDAVAEAAARSGVTISDWVRRVVRAARDEQGSADVPAKLAAVRAAAALNLEESPDISTMLAEIERGYLG